MKKKTLLIPLALLLTISLVAIGCQAAAPTPAPAPELEVFEWTMQTGTPAGDPNMVMAEDMAANIEKMSAGRLKITVLPTGAVVPAKEIAAAVDKRVLDAGLHWTHYQIGKNPAAGLFSSPPGAVGLGYDQTVLTAWYKYGGSRSCMRNCTTTYSGRT